MVAVVTVADALVATVAAARTAWMAGRGGGILRKGESVGGRGVSTHMGVGVGVDVALSTSLASVGCLVGDSISRLIAGAGSRPLGVVLKDASIFGHRQAGAMGRQGGDERPCRARSRDLELQPDNEGNLVARITQGRELHTVPKRRPIFAVVLDDHGFFATFLTRRFQLLDFVSVRIGPLQEPTIVAQDAVHAVTGEVHEPRRAIHDGAIGRGGVGDAKRPLRTTQPGVVDQGLVGRLDGGDQLVDVVGHAFGQLHVAVEEGLGGQRSRGAVGGSREEGWGRIRGWVEGETWCRGWCMYATVCVSRWGGGKRFISWVRGRRAFVITCP